MIDFGPVNLTDLHSKHIATVGKQYGSIEGMIDNYYRLESDAMLQVSRSVNGSLTQSLMSDGMASKIILHQSILVNHNVRSIASKFWIQLGILDDIKDTIVDYKQSKDSNCLFLKSFGAPRFVTLFMSF